MSIAFHHIPVERDESGAVLVAGRSVETGVADARAFVAFSVSTAADPNPVLFDLPRAAERAVLAGVARIALAVVVLGVVFFDALAVAAALEHFARFGDQART